jgi:hypothetical protein
MYGSVTDGRVPTKDNFVDLIHVFDKMGYLIMLSVWRL